MPIFASAFRETTRNDGCKIARCGSSAWLERRPVTPEVEGSSPFRTAKVLEISSGLFFVYICVGPVGPVTELAEVTGTQSSRSSSALRQAQRPEREIWTLRQAQRPEKSKSMRFGH